MASGPRIASQMVSVGYWVKAVRIMENVTQEIHIDTQIAIVETVYMVGEGRQLL